jgi:hypothetical protein
MERLKERLKYVPRLYSRLTNFKRRTVLHGCCFAAAFTFIVNLIATIIYSTRKPAITLVISYDADQLIFFGDCKTASTLDSLLHIIINVLSTIMLAASNLCMQLLIAPTRMDIDRAHNQRRWLDIGRPSLRNFLHVDKSRQAVWALLAVSSLPLNLLCVQFPMLTYLIKS